MLSSKLGSCRSYWVVVPGFLRLINVRNKGQVKANYADLKKKRKSKKSPSTLALSLQNVKVVQATLADSDISNSSSILDLIRVFFCVISGQDHIQRGFGLGCLQIGSCRLRHQQTANHARGRRRQSLH